KVLGDMLRVHGATTDCALNSSIAVICSSYSLPSLTVFSSALNELLVHCKSDRVRGWARLLTMRTTILSLVWASLEILNTAIVGVISIGFQTVPLICSTTLDWLRSLQVTVVCFMTVPPKLA